MTDHLETASLARYLGGAGTPDERARWEAHLSECADCREEMVEVRRIVATAPARRRAWLAPLAAAARRRRIAALDAALGDDAWMLWRDHHGMSIRVATATMASPAPARPRPGWRSAWAPASG